jgi:hypothetical protein
MSAQLMERGEHKLLRELILDNFLSLKLHKLSGISSAIQLSSPHRKTTVH